MSPRKSHSQNTNTPLPQSANAPAVSPPPKQAELELFSPKNAKTANKRKHSMIEDIPSSVSSSAKSKKRVHDGQHERRDPPQESVAAGPTATRPAQQAGPSKNAQRTLEKLQKRKKANSNIFIKK